MTKMQAYQKIHELLDAAIELSQELECDDAEKSLLEARKDLILLVLEDTDRKVT